MVESMIGSGPAICVASEHSREHARLAPSSGNVTVMRAAMDQDDVLLAILRKLPVSALVTVASVCRRWLWLARSDSAGWRVHCASRWYGKQVPWGETEGAHSWYARYVRIEEELTRRAELSDHELCRRMWRLSELKCQFQDGVLLIEHHPPLRYRWGDDHRSLHVGSFPKHTVERLTDWSWKISNVYEAFVSLSEVEPLWTRELWPPSVYIVQVCPRPHVQSSLIEKYNND
mmetsp:Transcript_18971/g.48906  ORF Transcript_18971/g.48906 Transcript_18971/m.48906 type:complete len:231 (+) Transcript_18971:64-756(+)